MDELPFRRNVERLPLFGLGCAGEGEALGLVANQLTMGEQTRDRGAAVTPHSHLHHAPRYSGDVGMPRNLASQQNADRYGTAGHPL